jgi:hypothetical protein
MRNKVYVLVLCVFLGFIIISCSGGGSGGSGGGGGGTPPPKTVSYVVLAANDLGMHCMDREFSIFSILPPFNVINAQVIGHLTDGSPVLLGGGDVDVRYNAVADATGSINSHSIGKTDFWGYVNTLFGTSLADGEGLTGRYMPRDAFPAGAQPFDYNATHGWFSAGGVPITPIDDASNTNPFPLIRVAAYSSPSSSTSLGRLDVVVPVATETDCRSCHATGEIGASRAGVLWATDSDVEVQSKKNILSLHDLLVGTIPSLISSTPVLCAQCHYSRALDLSGSGPSGDQVGNPTFSGAMHNYHGKLTDSGSPVLPDTLSSCYSCHPGQITRCQRGAMKTGNMDCIDCHGGMLAVGAEYNLQTAGSIDGTNDGNPRRPWLDMPRCQACHTGDAGSYLTSGSGLVHDSSYPFRLRQAYRTGDPAASPLMATNKRFAENTNTLYRFSKGHGGVFCQGCHGSTHAEWPNATASANDNVAAKALQGYAGKIIECTVCHESGSLGLTINGPHGLHNINNSRWVDGRHGSYYERDPSGCRACHGTNLLGTPLARVTAARSFNVEGAATLAKDELVRCNRCHDMPD